MGKFPNGAVEEAVRLVAEHGSVCLASKASGIAETTLRRRYLAANVDPAISASMEAVGTMMIPQLAWAKTKSEDGISYSVLLKPVANAEDALERIRAAFEGMEPAEPVTPPERVLDDLCSVYPVMDLHLGMHAWGRETGGAS